MLNVCVHTRFIYTCRYIYKRERERERWGRKRERNDIIVKDWLAYNMSILLHDHYGEKHGTKQANMVLKDTSEFYIWIHRWLKQRETLNLA